jgi:uncharacterized protein (TIGR00369 family)
MDGPRRKDAPSVADFDQTPVNRWLGFRLVACDPKRVVIEQTVRPEMLQENGVVQGGLLTALADTAAVYLLWPELGERRDMTGTSASVQFLAAARAAAGPLKATATPVRVGRRIAVCESSVSQGERLICKGVFTFLLSENA